MVYKRYKSKIALSKPEKVNLMIFLLEAIKKNL